MTAVSPILHIVLFISVALIGLQGRPATSTVFGKVEKLKYGTPHKISLWARQELYGVGKQQSITRSHTRLSGCLGMEGQDRQFSCNLLPYHSFRTNFDSQPEPVNILL